MKHLRVLLFVALIGMFTSCSKDDTPDNKIHKTEKNLSIGQDQKVHEVVYTIAPTWGQANKWAAERGDHAIWVVIGWILLLGLGFWIYMYATQKPWAPQMSTVAQVIIGGLLLALSILSFRWQAMRVHASNDTLISKVEYDRLNGNTKPFWDSLRNACLIEDGPYDCYK